MHRIICRCAAELLLLIVSCPLPSPLSPCTFVLIMSPPCCNFGPHPAHAPSERTTCPCLPPAPAEKQSINHPQSRKDEFDLDDDPEAAAEAAERGDEGAAAGGKFAWSNTDREYTYDELLGEWDCCCCSAAAAVVCCTRIITTQECVLLSGWAAMREVWLYECGPNCTRSCSIG